MSEDNQIFYCTVAACVTALIIAVLYLTSEYNRYKMELVIECFYARGEFEDSVTGCVRDIDTILNWKKE